MIVSLLEKLEIQSAHIIGHDIGGGTKAAGIRVVLGGAPCALKRCGQRTAARLHRLASRKFLGNKSPWSPLSSLYAISNSDELSAWRFILWTAHWIRGPD